MEDLVKMLKDRYDYLGLTGAEFDGFIQLDAVITQLIPPISYVKQFVQSITPERLKNRKQPTYVYRSSDFVMHLTDCEWMTNFINEKLKIYIKDTMNINTGVAINLHTIKKYVTTSKNFLTIRDAYLQELMKSCVELCLEHKPESEFFGKISEFEYNHPNYDDKYRQHVIKVATALGVGPRDAAFYLEHNANKWRNRVQQHAFCNTYVKYKPRSWDKHAQRPFFMEEIDNIEAELANKWVALREYQYGLKYQILLRMTNTFTKPMQMSEQQAKKLALETTMLSKDYFNKIDSYKFWDSIKISDEQPELFSYEDLKQPDKTDLGREC